MFKLHLRYILLLKMSNIFHYWAVVPLCDFDHIQKPLLYFPKETRSAFISTKMMKNPKSTQKRYRNEQ